LTRPIIARLRSESHLNNRITSRGSHQSLSQQNLPIAAVSRCSNLARHVAQERQHWRMVTARFIKTGHQMRTAGPVVPS
jgi:hypothetical protein